jgi:membrane-associated protease RseP (regulator of RpoE activity)
MAGDIKNKRVNIYIDQTAAQAAYDKLIAQQTKWTKSIEAGQAQGKSMVNELKKLDGVNSQIKNLQNQMDNGLKPTLQQQKNLVAQLRNELNRLSESDPKFAKLTENFKKQSAELQRMKTNVEGVTKSSDGLNNVLSKIAALAAGAFAFDKIVGFFKDSISEANEAQQSLSKFKNILDNVGRSDAFDRLKNKADEMQRRFKFIDNDEVIGVFQKLITYGKLTEKQIDDLTPVIIDFATKAGTSLDEATGVVIKALEGNSKALKEYGINMKDGATVTERMSILMGQLKPKVDGAADAFGLTFAGRLAIAKQHLKDIEEEVGNKLIPILTKFLGLADKALTGVSALGTLIGEISDKGLLAGDASFHRLAAENQQKPGERERRRFSAYPCRRLEC